MAKYWKSIDNNTSNKEKEQNKGKGQTTRRDFLKTFGFGLASTLVLSRCESVTQKAIPYLIKPEELTPSKASYYASSFFDGNTYSSILVKVLDGRPIKIEGNDLSSMSQGATNGITQASILSLYDDNRYRNPLINGEKTNWENIDNEIITQLEKLSQSKEKVALVSPSIISPSTQKVIDRFVKKYPNVKYISYDVNSCAAMLDANRESFQKAFIPNYLFDKPELIVGVNADFLGSWLSPVEYTRQYVTNRKVDASNRKMSLHIQIETGMSLTGSNADKRIIIKPSEEQNLLANLYNSIAQKLNKKRIIANSCAHNTDELAALLLRKKGKSLLVCGTNNKETQILVNTINHLLENYGKTISFDQALLTKQSNDNDMLSLIKELDSYSGFIFFDCNPVYDYPEFEKFKNAITKAKLSIALTSVPNETSVLTKYVCPSHNYLEAWNDFNPKLGLYSLSQPCIRAIFNTRQEQDSLLKWSQSQSDFQSFMKSYWQKNMYTKTPQIVSFDQFWRTTLQKGVFEQKIKSQPLSFTYDIDKINIQKPLPGLELHIYESVNIACGKHANNPWLQELPDPVSKVTWDNYAAISPALAKERDLKTGDIIKINNRIKIPVLVQPGQANNTVSIALGYGRTVSGKAGKNIGANVSSMIAISDYRNYHQTNIIIDKTLHHTELATTQLHDSMEGRDIIRETSLLKYKENPESGNEKHKKIEKHHQTLYSEHHFEGHHWGMAVDLNACIGCNACVAACNIENNIPVVGKKEVLKAHEMHWLRIDRYYSGDSENPEVVRQPVMCQHCDHAPCENVCPVGATNHSSEGLNQMAYNRCIGTRYCNNNCPYKVRRFNWLDYNKSDALEGNLHDPHKMTSDLSRMVLNPDVTIRAKGVIEKCSFCIQRIQEKKLKAKLENRKLKDGEIKPACQQVCAADAIVFGDLNDKNSKVYKLFKQQRRYHLLEELHTLPSVGYLTKIRNK